MTTKLVQRVGPPGRPHLTINDLEIGDLFERDCKNPQTVYMVVEIVTKRPRRVPIKSLIDLNNARRINAYDFGTDTPVRRLKVIRPMQAMVGS